MIDAAYLNTLPAWARHLAVKYATHTVSQFLLHGNVRDLVPLRRPSGVEFHHLADFLTKSMFAGRDFVLYYDRAHGLTFADNNAANDFALFMKAYQAVQGGAATVVIQVPKEPSLLFPLIDRYLRTRVAEGRGLALIVQYAELIAPHTDTGSLAEGDRATLVYLRNWADDPAFLRADVTFCLIAEQLGRLNQDLVRNPFAVPVEIDLPDRDERLEFIAAESAGFAWDDLAAVGRETVAELTAGLARVHIQQVMAEATRHQRRLDMPSLLARKKELIESECFDLLEFIEPHFTLDMVAGADPAVRELRDTARLLRAGRLDVLPMGYLICGPVGTGKTFLATCFTGEIGVPCVRLLNIRSQWQGVTEANLQKVLGILRAMGPLGVMIDEADTWIGDRDAGGDSGTSQRVFGAIASFMADTSLRGRVIWFLLTARPDLLPVDIKRQGRAEEHIPLFHPETAGDRQALFTVFVRKNHLDTAVTSIESHYQDAGAPRLSGADFEAVCIRAKRLAALADAPRVEDTHFAAAFAQFVPPVYAEEIEYQTLAAVLECTNRALLPERFRDLPRREAAVRLRELRALID